MVQAAFLRSINIQLDAGHPERFEHFRPTSKSARLFSSLLLGKKRSSVFEKGNAIFVVAPYGSGKSITAGYLGYLVANCPEVAEMLGLVENRLTGVNPDLREQVARRRTAQRWELFVPLYGHASSAPAALRQGLLDAMRRAALGRQARTIAALDATRTDDIPALACRSHSRKLGQRRQEDYGDERCGDQGSSVDQM